jgi:hypothetical protein
LKSTYVHICDFEPLFRLLSKQVDNFSGFPS